MTTRHGFPFRLLMIGIVGVSFLFSGVANASLIGHWTLDEPDGTSPIADSSGSGFDATATGNPVLGIPGVVGTAGSFPGGGNYFRTGPDNDLNLNSYTFSLWFNAKENVNSDFQTIVSNRTGEDGFILYRRFNTVQYWHRNAAGWNSQSFTITAGTDQWYHFVGSYDLATGAKSFYATSLGSGSANILGTLSTSGTFLAAGAPSFGIGIRGASTALPLNGGYIDDVQLYSRALSSSEVNFLFQNPGAIIVPEPGNAVLLLTLLGAAASRRRRRPLAS